jgi:hypothetical protein
MLHSPCMRVWEHIKQEVQRRGHKKAAAWLGEKCGYSAQQMTNWAGKRDIPPKEFGTIAHALGVTVDWVTSASGRAPKDEELAEVPSPAPTSPDEKRMLDALRMLRPETREAVLAFADLLPEDQDELGRPIIERAAHMRKYLDAALARHGVTHTRNNLPMAPPFAGVERRSTSSPHEPERRNTLLRHADIEKKSGER